MNFMHPFFNMPSYFNMNEQNGFFQKNFDYNMTEDNQEGNSGRRYQHH